MREIGPSLEKLVGALEGLLAVLDAGAAADPDALKVCWGRCSDAFERFRAQVAASSSVPAPVHERFVHLQKVYAIAASLAGRAREEVAAEIARVSEVRSRLRARGMIQHTGRSCDIRG